MTYMSDDLANIANNLKQMVNAQKHNALVAGQRKAISLGAEAKITGNRYLDVTFSKRSATGGVIDLKEGFERGASARHKKNGGWYTIVPIRRKVSDMTRQAYNQVRELEGIPSSTRYIDYLYGGKPLTDDALSSFGITTQTHGGNLSRVAKGATKGNYYAFRTVSDKSAPSSWLLLRDRAKAQAEENEKLKQIGDTIQQTLMSYGE